MSHTIRRGDTLSKIALQYGTTVNELAKLNNIKNVDLIPIGKKLLLPTEKKPSNTFDAIQQLNEKTNVKTTEPTPTKTPEEPQPEITATKENTTPEVHRYREIFAKTGRTVNKNSSVKAQDLLDRLKSSTIGSLNQEINDSSHRLSFSRETMRDWDVDLNWKPQNE